MLIRHKAVSICVLRSRFLHPRVQTWHASTMAMSTTKGPWLQNPPCCWVAKSRSPRRSSWAPGPKSFATASGATADRFPMFHPLRSPKPRNRIRIREPHVPDCVSSGVISRPARTTAEWGCSLKQPHANLEDLKCNKTGDLLLGTRSY